MISRVDDLGRVALPEDIRKVMRLREGDPLEVFMNREGEVILKKCSPIGELGYFAKEYAESLYETLGHISMIADRDVIIAVAGGNKREFLSKPVGKLLEKSLEDRNTIIINDMENVDDENMQIIQTDDREYVIKAQVVAPIITQGDPIGAVMIVSKDPGVELGELEIKLAETAAGFLAKQMEHSKGRKYMQNTIVELEQALYNACKFLAEYSYYGECPSAIFGDNYFEDCNACDYENADVAICWRKYFVEKGGKVG